MRKRAQDPKAVDIAARAMPDEAAEQRIRDNMAVLSSPARVKILRTLARTELAAGDLALVIGRSRPATSQHLVGPLKEEKKEEGE